LVGRLTEVREITLSDAPTLFKVLSDELVTPHISPPPPDVDALAGFIRWSHEERRSGRGFCVGIVPHGLNAAVGLIQLRALDPAFDVAEWGFALGAAFWSTGIFVEAAGLLAEYAFQTLGVRRIEARSTTSNDRGNAVLQKLGAHAEAVLSRSLSQPTGWRDQLLWSLTEEDYRQRATVPRCNSDQAMVQIARAVAETQAELRPFTPSIESPGRMFPFFIASSHKKSDG
jgi:ribosomal-protein-alanine N-acetyltransferase